MTAPVGVLAGSPGPASWVPEGSTAGSRDVLFRLAVSEVPVALKNMIPSFTYLDRYRNEGTRAYSLHADYTEADERYRPNSRVSTFDIPAFEVPSDELNIYAADPDPALRRLYTSEDRTLFCVHPQVLDAHGDDPYLKRVLSFGKGGKDIRVCPSGPTVVSEPAE